MLATLLDALASFVERIDFDFVVNLSDADLALRTSAEMVRFLRRFKGRSFLQAALPQPRSYRRFVHDELGAIAAIECGGFGFVAINTSAPRLTPERPCCFGAEEVASREGLGCDHDCRRAYHQDDHHTSRIHAAMMHQARSLRGHECTLR